MPPVCLHADARAMRAVARASPRQRPPAAVTLKAAPWCGPPVGTALTLTCRRDLGRPQDVVRSSALRDSRASALLHRSQRCRSWRRRPPAAVDARSCAVVQASGRDGAHAHLQARPWSFAGCRAVISVARIAHERAPTKVSTMCPYEAAVLAALPPAAVDTHRRAIRSTADRGDATPTCWRDLVGMPDEVWSSPCHDSRASALLQARLRSLCGYRLCTKRVASLRASAIHAGTL